jgi:hypothetical protein
MKQVAYRAVSEAGLSQEQFDKILCPNLRVGVRMGLLNPDPNGWVSRKEIEEYLVYTGVKDKSGIQKALVHFGETATIQKKEGQVNITEFKGSFLDHGSSSGILNNAEGFSEHRLNHLKSFSQDGTTLTVDDLADAASNFNLQPFNFASFRGSQLQSLELAALLKIFGKSNGNGARYFTLDDIDSLWKHNKFPDGWIGPREPKIGTFTTLVNYLSLTISRLKGR